MRDQTDLRAQIIEMEPALLNIGQGLRTARLILSSIEDQVEHGHLYFILDALLAQHAEAHGRWLQVHSAACRSEPPGNPGPRLVDQGGKP